MANAPVSRLGIRPVWTSVGPSYDSEIMPLTDIPVIYSVDGHMDILPSRIAAVIVDQTGTITTDVNVDRVSRSWVLCSKKNIPILLIVEERFAPTFDTILGGDGNYALIARILHRDIVQYQNV